MLARSAADLGGLRAKAVADGAKVVRKGRLAADSWAKGVATDRLTSASCPPGTDDTPNATCKPASDAHQPFGVGRRDQLAYYSNYGARIDIAAPGGARKFNLGAYDRGGTPGFPVTAHDLTNAWQTFSTTSNWAVEIPCFTFTAGSGFPQGQC